MQTEKLDFTQLGDFRSRFQAKPPAARNFVRRVTKFDFYLTVEDLVEDRRGKGFAWEGIAEDFTALGVPMRVSTLKTCFRRARVRKLRDTSGAPRSKRPSRRWNRARPEPGDAARGEESPVACNGVSAGSPERPSAPLAATPAQSPPASGAIINDGSFPLEPSEPLAAELAVAPVATSGVEVTTNATETAETPSTNGGMNMGSREEEPSTELESTALSAASGEAELTSPIEVSIEAGEASAESRAAARARQLQEALEELEQLPVTPPNQPRLNLAAIRARAAAREPPRMAFIPTPDPDEL